jgi:outer membrane immunogenic protein
MKNLCFGSVALLAVACPAVAADMPVKSPVYKAAPVAVYNWSGFYAGLNAGYGWGDTSSI